LAKLLNSNKFYFRKSTYAGLDIGSTSIKIAEVKSSDSGLTLVNFFFSEIPVSLKENEQKRDRFIFDTIIRAQQEEKFKTPYVYLALSGPEVNVLSVNMPKVPPKDMHKAIILEAKKQMQFDVHKVFLHYQPSRELIDKSGIRIILNVAIANKDMVMRKINLLEEVGLRPVGLTIVPVALGNTLKCARLFASDKVVGVLDLGATATNLALYRQGVLEFSREIALGQDYLTQSLMRQMVFEERTIILNFDDAEELKKECGIPMREQIQEKIGFVPKSEVLNLMRPALERLSTEILRSVNFYRHTSGVDAVEKLFLCGGGARLMNIKEYFSTSLKGMKVEILEVSQAISTFAPGVDKNSFQEVSSFFALSIGLAQGISKPQIDFLPFEIRLKRIIEKVRLLFKVTLPSLFIIVLAFWFAYTLQIPYYKQLIAKAKSNMLAFQNKLALAEQYKVLANRFSALYSRIRDIQAKQPLWGGVLKELSALTPEWISLERVELITSSTPLKLKIQGQISSTYTSIDLSLSQYLLALDESVFFDNVKLVSKTQDVYSGLPRAKFEIICQLVY